MDCSCITASLCFVSGAKHSARRELRRDCATPGWRLPRHSPRVWRGPAVERVFQKRRFGSKNTTKTIWIQNHDETRTFSSHVSTRGMCAHAHPSCVHITGWMWLDPQNRRKGGRAGGDVQDDEAVLFVGHGRQLADLRHDLALRPAARHTQTPLSCPMVRYSGHLGTRRALWQCSSCSQTRRTL